MNKKKKKINPTKKKTAKTSALKSSKTSLIKPVKNTSGYYLCMGACCKGKNITQVARECKTNAPALVAQRKKKVQELARAAKIIGKFAQDLEKVLQH
jgi:uncharacterized circularly permuted ATP-grasp superfamily protein